MEQDLPVNVTLDDKSILTLRAVGPQDRILLRDAFSALSAESRYMRFLSQRSDLSTAELDSFTAPNDTAHTAIGALFGDKPVGIARFIRTDDPVTAEIAFTVSDGFQGRGIGSALLEMLMQIAVEQDIAHFIALVHSGNTAMRRLLWKYGGTVTQSHGRETEYQIDLAAAADRRQLRA
jgi:RimJ/RimL family protein N-acetyltransferase